MKEKMKIPLTPYVPENLVSRDGFSRSVPRQPAHLHTQAEPGVYSRDSSRFPRRRPFIYLNRHTPLSQSRVYRVTQLRTNGVPVTRCCHFAGRHGPINVRLSFPTSTCGMNWACCVIGGSINSLIEWSDGSLAYPLVVVVVVSRKI